MGLFTFAKKEVVLGDSARYLIEKGEALVASTRERVKNEGTDKNLTFRFQLRDDCQSVERCIQKLRRGGSNEKAEWALAKAIRCLETTSANILDREKDSDMI